MPTRISTPRRIGRFLAGLGALALLVVLLAGAPVALVALGGNPLPDHLPTFAEVTGGLTSRDDGQLFLRVLALLGWLGWASFAVSVLAETGALLGRRRAPRLPGLRRQQQIAAALLGGLALLAPFGAAAQGLAGTIGGDPAATPAVATGGPGVRPAGAFADRAEPHAAGTRTGRANTSGAGAGGVAGDRQEGRLLYRVAGGDYLGGVAQRYLGDFDRYPELARLNGIGNPDLIHPGQQVRLPAGAEDAGPGPHAAGRATRATPPDPPSKAPSTPPAIPAQPPVQATPSAPAAPATSAPATEGPASTAPTSGPASAAPTAGPGSAAPSATGVPVGAPAAGYDATDRRDDELNRPLAISAVLAVAAIIGAQAGAILGLRRRRGRRD